MSEKVFSENFAKSGWTDFKNVPYLAFSSFIVVNIVSIQVSVNDLVEYTMPGIKGAKVIILAFKLGKETKQI